MARCSIETQPLNLRTKRIAELSAAARRFRKRQRLDFGIYGVAYWVGYIRKPWDRRFGWKGIRSGRESGDGSWGRSNCVGRCGGEGWRESRDGSRRTCRRRGGSDCSGVSGRWGKSLCGNGCHSWRNCVSGRGYDCVSRRGRWGRRRRGLRNRNGRGQFTRRVHGGMTVRYSRLKQVCVGLAKRHALIYMGSRVAVEDIFPTVAVEIAIARAAIYVVFVGSDGRVPR